MARGWESKSVKAQIEEGEQAGGDSRARKARAMRLRDERLESIRLSRSRIEQQLSNAVHPAHRAMLMKGLEALEKEAEEIASQSASSDA